MLCIFKTKYWTLHILPLLDLVHQSSLWGTLGYCFYPMFFKLIFPFSYNLVHLVQITYFYFITWGQEPCCPLLTDESVHLGHSHLTGCKFTSLLPSLHLSIVFISIFQDTYTCWQTTSSTGLYHFLPVLMCLAFKHWKIF